MLATILKSGRATETTLAIVEAFAKLKELLQKSGDIIAELLGEGMSTSDTETSIELKKE